MESLFETVVNYWKYNFWFSTICTISGLLVIAPLFFSKRLRKRLSKVDIDPEFIGMVALAFVIVGIAIYNNL